MSLASINQEIQSLTPTAVVELFVLQVSGNPDTRFHAGTNKLMADITWNGDVYSFFPIEVEGFEITGQGLLPTPVVRVANALGTITSLTENNNDLIGATLVRRRTFLKFLDAVNYPGGLNPDADATQAFPEEFYQVEQKLQETNEVVEFQLISILDAERVRLPGRQVVADTCPWVYRGSECGFAGGAAWSGATPYVLDDIVLSVGIYYRCILGHTNQLPPNATYWEVDTCRKSLDECGIQSRFPTGSRPFGGFPGVSRVPLL